MTSKSSPDPQPLQIELAGSDPEQVRGKGKGSAIAFPAGSRIRRVGRQKVESYSLIAHNHCRRRWPRKSCRTSPGQMAGWKGN